LAVLPRAARPAFRRRNGERPALRCHGCHAGEKSPTAETGGAAWLLGHREGSRRPLDPSQNCRRLRVSRRRYSPATLSKRCPKRPSTRPPIVETGAAAWSPQFRHRQRSRGWTRWRSRLTGFAATLTVSISERKFFNWSVLKTHLGVSDLRTLGTWACVRRSMGPERADPQAWRAGRKYVQDASFAQPEPRGRLQRHLRRMVAVLC
jgi:hypothetical protein